MGRFRDAWRALTGARSMLSSDEPWASLLAADATASGVRVTPEKSMRVAAVYAGVRLLAESVSSLPVDVVRRDGNRRQVVENDLSRVITEEPNPEQDPAALWRDVMGWMLLEGNAYLYVERDRGGRPLGLWPLPSTAITIGRSGPRRRLHYDITFAGLLDDRPGAVPQAARLGPENVLHFKAFGTGLYGLSPIRQIREAVATSLAAQEYMARFYKNDARPGGVVQVPGELSDTQYKRMQEAWRSHHEGLKRSHLMAILEGGASWESVGLNPGDAAFIETQKWERTEVATALGIPPHMIGDVERSTSWGTGIAEQGIGFVTYGLTPWITRLEWVTRRGLLAPRDRQLRSRWRVEGLQRGDAQARYTAYATARQWGWMSANDVRAFEDMDPVPGGDTYLQPLNMVPAGTDPTEEDDEEPAEPASEPEQPQSAARRRSREGRRRIARSFAPLIVDADRRVAKLERSEVRKLVRQHLRTARSTTAFLTAVEQLYRGTIRDRMTSRWAPIFTAFAAEIATDASDEVGNEEAPDLQRWAEAYVASHVAYRVASAVGQLRAAVGGADDVAGAVEAVDARLNKWTDKRPERTGRWESTQMSQAAAREVWRSSGVRELRWVTVGRDCPYCTDLDGSVVGITEPFLANGTQLADGDEELTADRDIHHPPAHPGCNCEVVPG